MLQFNKLVEKVKNLNPKYDDIYIYGCGFYGKDIYRILIDADIKIKGFLTTEAPESKECMGISVYKASEKIHNDSLIVLAMSDTYTKDVLAYLDANNVSKERIIDGGIYLTSRSGRDIYRKNPVLEITAVVGCKVNCKYCPQSVLINSYFKDNPSREKFLKPEVFAKILKHISSDTDIMFAGMGEPMLNPYFLELMTMACNTENRVLLFSSLVGGNLEIIQKLVKLPIDYFNLHVADDEQNAKIPLTEEYYQMLKFLVNAKKRDNHPFIDYASAQGSVDKKASEILRGCVNVMVALHDRGGNILAADVEKRKEPLKKTDKIFCNCLGGMLNSNVVMPDGTLVLCQSDYGMRHVLGNLYLDTMDTIRKGDVFKEISKAMNGDSDMDLLCRKCLIARKA